ncbi:MAG TPA: VOC family protein [Candidatus Acidoferrum sp.]|nr:VOC family protein [Candidatus Acidoferrum sp.]
MNWKSEHIGLAARDPVALKDWYIRVLGAQLVFSNQQPRAFLLRLPGGGIIELYGGKLAVPETSNNELNGWRHLALRVDSIASAKAELEQKGVKLDQPIKPAGGGGSVLFFHDPEGNLLHLVERPADSRIH